MAPDTCRCGHSLDEHTHLHDRTYCGSCGPTVCAYFRREPGEHPVLSWLRRRLARVRGH